MSSISSASPPSEQAPDNKKAADYRPISELLSTMYAAAVLGNKSLVTTLYQAAQPIDRKQVDQAVKTAEKITKMGKIADILKILGAIFLSIGIALAIGATVSLFLMPAIAVPLALAAASTAAVGLSLLIGQNALQVKIQDEALKLTHSLIP